MIWPVSGTGVVNITSIIGSPSGIDWSKFINIGSAKATQAGQPDASFNLPTVVVCPVYASVDNSITVTIVASTAYGWSLLEATDDVLQGSSQEPIATIDAYGPFGYGMWSGATGVTTHLIGSPAAGFQYEVRQMSVWAPSTAASTTGNVRIQAANGTFLIGSYSQAAGLWIWSSTIFYINVGIDVSNTLGVTCSASLIYRSIPLLKG